MAIDEFVSFAWPSPFYGIMITHPSAQSYSQRDLTDLVTQKQVVVGVDGASQRVLYGNDGVVSLPTGHLQCHVELFKEIIEGKTKQTHT